MEESRQKKITMRGMIYTESRIDEDEHKILSNHLKEINIDLYDYLIENNVLDQFYYNLLKHSRYRCIDATDVTTRYNNRINILNIDSAFNWNSTNEGHTFWQKLHDRFCNKVYREADKRKEAIRDNKPLDSFY